MALSLDSWWQLIEDARTKAGTPTGHDDGAPFIAALKTSLTKASEDDLVTFQLTFDRLLDDSYTWPLWGVAFIMKGGCSDDAFVSFRGWLVAQGKTTFEAAVKDPQSIGDVVKPGGTYELEPLVGLAADVWAEANDQDASDFYDLMPTRPTRTRPSGTKWDEYEVDALFPRVAKRFKTV